MKLKATTTFFFFYKWEILDLTLLNDEFDTKLLWLSPNI